MIQSHNISYCVCVCVSYCVYVCVYEWPQMNVYEAVVPKRRGPLPQVCGMVMCVVCFLLGSVCMSGVPGLGQAAEQALYGLCIGVVLHGACLLVEEATAHFTQRYNGNVIGLLKACVCWQARACVCVLAVACVLRGEALSVGELGSVLIIASCYLLLKTTGVLAPSATEMSEISESQQMNVAHGLAWSFYLGYLKLVLPLLEAAVEKYNVQRRGLSAEGALGGPWASRLHILLPLSASVCAHLEDDDPRVCFHDNLPPMEMDRAGVRKRVFKNSVYSIRDANGQAHYCILESATPLLTLHQMSEEGSAGFGVSERRQQVLLFYRTLRGILEASPDCRNHYRLILLDDTNASEPHFLSTEILKHLRQQEGEEFSMIQPMAHSTLPQQEKGLVVANGTTPPLPNQPMSSTTLMISGLPRTLQSEPEENSEY
ncbi:hypothetical protein ACEWY4_015520 [Coilia grayii]|uniref:Stimulator of interferon genes protein n=1 Tax=Coilia grayii TaxID=363190 RepID=A0ABD1JPB4_9TELE